MNAVPAVRDDAPYQWPWLLAIGGLLAGLFYVVFLRTPVPTFSVKSVSVSADQADSFLLIHMPSIAPTDKLAARRVESWLTAMGNKGYRPLLLSEANNRLLHGRGLPRKSVVLIFDPAYRETFKVISPLLASHKFPAVWIIDAEKVKEGDRRYLDGHTVKAMQNSACWDIGHYDENSRLHLDLSNTNSVPVAKSERMNVNLSWTPQQFIDFLQAGQPVRVPSYLFLKKIQNHNTGLSMPVSSSQDPVFSLKSSLEGRTGSAAWHGTKGMNDMTLDVEARGVTGEFWLLFRSDEEVGENVGVCFGNGTVIVAEQVNHAMRRLLTVKVPSLTQPSQFQATVVLNGKHINVYLGGALVAHSRGLTVKATRNSLLRLMVYDKIQGAAQAESVKLLMTPVNGKSAKSEI